MRTLLSVLPEQIRSVRRGDHSWLSGTLFGAALVFGTTVVKLAFAESIGSPTPFLLYFAAIMGAAYRGGGLAGLATTILSALVAKVLFMPSGEEELQRELAAVSVFLFEGLCIASVMGGFIVQRTAARRALHEAELATAQRDLVLSGVGEGIALQDPQGNILYANRLAAETAGCSSVEEFLALEPVEVVRRLKFQDAEGRPLPLEELPGRRLIQGLSAPELSVRFHRHGDDKERWGIVRANALRDEQGRVQYVVNLFRDVTEAREHEAELSLAREWFQIALRSIGDAVIATDPEGNINLLNPIAEQLTGWKAEDALGRPLEDVFKIIREGSRETVESPVRQVLRSGSIVGLANHTLLLRPDGSEIAIDDSASPIRASNDELAGVILVFRDVSPKRADEARAAFLARATEELNSSLDYRETLATVARLAVPAMADWCAVDIQEDGTLTRLAVAHVDPEKVERLRELERRYPADPEAPNGVHHILRTGESEMIEEIPREVLEAQARDEEHKGAIFELGLGSYIGVPLKRLGEPFGVITLVMAESKRRYGEKDLAVAQTLADRASLAVENARLYRDAMGAREIAEAASRTKDEFLAMLGHELRNPLAPIRSALELMSSRPGDGHDREVAIIQRQTDHLVRLVDDLLDVARITHGRLELERRPAAISEIIERALEVTWPPGAHATHQLHVEIPVDFSIECDFVRLSQVVANLVHNSIKYTSRGGNIWILAKSDNKHATITVRDDGMGIDPATLDQVFQRFVQAPQALDRAQGGLGLGLSIVQGIVSAHGGRVSARSDGLGQGTEVTVELPLGRISIPPQMERAKKTVTPARILIVDDNRDACELLAALLELEGHAVSTAFDGPSALSVADREKPEVALLDVGLPGMSGYELGQRLRSLPGLEDIRIVAVTGYGRPQDHERSQRESFLAHLVKPIDLDSLRAVLALGQKEAPSGAS
jgi:PAS domain S-box-containing protein